MPKPEIFAGIDVGSSQVVCVIARRTPSLVGPVSDSIEVIGASRVPCRGLKGGVVINIGEMAVAVSRAVEEAEEMAKEGVRDLLIAVRGSHIQTFNHHGALNIARTDKEITAEDVESVIENAKAVPISPDREIIHVIPQDFILDRQSGVPNPVGMEGNLLEVEVHIVTASSSHLNNVWKAVERAKFMIAEPIYGLLALGDVTVTQEEKELGSLLIDLGGQTTGLALYVDGSVRFTKELPVGSDSITYDLSHGLRTSLAQAQSVKERYGAAGREFLDDPIDEDIEFTSVDGRSPRHVRRKMLLEYIAPRVEEIFSMVADEVRNAGYMEAVMAGGVILTGGGSLLVGSAQAAQKILELDVRIGLPQDVEGIPDVVGHPSYSTAIGLIQYRHMGEWAKGRRATRRVGVGRKMKEWLDEVF